METERKVVKPMDEGNDGVQRMKKTEFYRERDRQRRAEDSDRQGWLFSTTERCKFQENVRNKLRYLIRTNTLSLKNLINTSLLSM